jgi:hypothetical protein
MKVSCAKLPLAVIAMATFCCSKPTVNQKSVRATIDSILTVQDIAYDENTEEGRQLLKSTCVDSLIFIGGDVGGMATTSDYYVHDLADGFTERPHDRTYRIYDNTAIVSSLHQSFKVFNLDTIYFNSRSTKVFVRQGSDWKMAYVTYAPLPVNYTRPVKFDRNKLSDYAGLYEVGPGVVDTVNVVDGRVYLSSGNAPRAELIPLNDSTFIGDGYVGRTIFSRNKKGQVTHNYFEFPDGQKIHFRKVK